MKNKSLSIFNTILTALLFGFVSCSLFSISGTQIAAGLGGLLWLFRTRLTATSEKNFWPLVVPIGLYVLACLVAVVNAYDFRSSYPELKKLLEILIFFWVVNCVRENRLRNSLSLTLILVGMGAGLLGFYQAWTDGVGIWRVNDDPFQTGQDWSPLGYTVDNRVEGTMSVYMTFAGLLMLVGMHALGRIFFRRPTEHWVWLPVIIISICLLFTLTRGAWFGFMVGLMFLVMVRLKKYLPIMLGLIIVGLLAFSSVLPQLRGMVKSTETITGPGFAKHFKQRISRMLSGNDETFAMRIALWNGGWEVFKDYPLTGCGFKCVDLVHSQYPDPTGHIKNLRGMHNNFVQLAVDTGILGLSAWIGIWVGFFGLLYKLAKTQKNNHSEGWLIYGSSASVIAFLAAGIFETNFYDSEVVMLLYFIMALPFTGLERKV